MNLAAYDAISDWYDGYTNSGSQKLLFDELVLPSLLELIGNVEHLPILDLACGQGVVTRLLARQGAKVVGVDISEKLLAIASKYEENEPLSITFIKDDAQALNRLKEKTFEGVVCNMALMDIADLSAVFRAVNDKLVVGGWFVFSITHPCFQTAISSWKTELDGLIYREVSGYFEEKFWLSNNSLGVRSRVGAYHRTVSNYFNALVSAGFAIQRVLEPAAQGKLAEAVPGYAQIPAVLLIRALKA